MDDKTGIVSFVIWMLVIIYAFVFMAIQCVVVVLMLALEVLATFWPLTVVVYLLFFQGH